MSDSDFEDEGTPRTVKLKPHDATDSEVDEPSPERFPLVNPQSVSDSDFEDELTPRSVKLQPRKRKHEVA